MRQVCMCVCVCRLFLFRIYSVARPRRPLPVAYFNAVCSAKFTGMNSLAFSVQSRCKLKIDRSPFCMRGFAVFVAFLMLLLLCISANALDLSMSVVLSPH